MADNEADETVIKITSEIEEEFGNNNEDNGQPQCPDNSDTDATYKLHEAAKIFNVQEVERLLAEGYDVNEKNSRGNNAVHTMLEEYIQLDLVQQIHAKPRYIEVLSLLARGGLDINSNTNSTRRTVLHFIVSAGPWADIIKPLMAAGVKVNAQDAQLRTPLHAAIRAGQVSNIQVLVEGGADVDITDSNGDAALHMLCKAKRKLPLVQLLIRCGANVNVRDRGLRTPLHIATKYSRTQLVRELLLSGAKVNARDTAGQSPLHYAMKYDMTGEIVKELLARKASVNMQDAISEDTPLHKSITHGTIEAFKLLVSSRPPPDPNVKDAQGETPLHRAATCQHVYVWKQLLKLGGDVNLPSDQGYSAVTKASRMKNAVALSLFREHGAHI